MDTSLEPGGTGNLFLDTLDAPTARLLLPMLSHVMLRKGQVLAEPNVAASRVYFPGRGVISTISRMRDGTSVEVGITGPEGFSSPSLAFGDVVSTQTSVVQIPSGAYTMDASVFASLVEIEPHLGRRARQYAHYIYSAAAQFSACNRIHAIDARYARWLLMADDRVGSDEFELTQEYCAQMLGVRRAGVTVAAGLLLDAGMISYRRGHVTVTDRDRLEETSCECYGVVNAQLRHLLGYDVRRSRSRTLVAANGATAAR